MASIFIRTLILGLGLVAALVLLAGCGDDEAVVVDFKKTLPAKRPTDQVPARPALRVAVAAMVTPQETHVLYQRLIRYLGLKLDREVEFVLRQTYREVNELFGRGGLDLAFMCSGPYVSGRDKYGFELMAAPEVRGSHFYHSYLLVGRDSPARSLADLRGTTFAFTDPDSNTGRLAPTCWLARINERPETFFGRTIYTYSHDNSIMAVARGLVDGAAVDSLIWDYYNEVDPRYTSQTRVIMKSEPYGIPPLVAAPRLPPGLKESLRSILFDMHQDAEGRGILAELKIDRFVPAQEEWYESVARMMLEAERMEGSGDGVFEP
ncbi:MAG: phosphate/phosphite/phosphonate ABC transporter substrate-binding protein [Thermodesulfobacteriota bacterium]